MQKSGGIRAGFQGLEGMVVPVKIKALASLRSSDYRWIAGIADTRQVVVCLVPISKGGIPMEKDLPELLAGEFTRLDAIRQTIATLRQQLGDGDSRQIALLQQAMLGLQVVFTGF